jgi:hypothetical protein
MFGNIVGAGARSRASAVEMNFRRRSASDIASMAQCAIFVGVTVALFFAWLSSANTGSRGLSADADCVSFGRGGARCVSHSDGGSNGVADARSDCISAGRGGLICERSATK